jgi:hypothetical protein
VTAAVRGARVRKSNDAQPSLADPRLFSSLLLAGTASATARAQPGGDPLPSRNDGVAKMAILEFGDATTRRDSPNFLPPEERIAEFDQDGTLWVEHPLYTQVVFCLDRVAVLAKVQPELGNREPFKTVLSGNREAIANLSIREFFEIALATQSGMTVEAFANDVKK